VQYLFLQALDFSMEGNAEDAINRLGEAVLIAPGFCSAYNVTGNCLNELGRYEKAIRTYGKVIEPDPSNQGAWFKRELVLLKVLRGSEEDQVTTATAWQKTGTPRTDDCLVPAEAEPLRSFRREP
jgi:tetratricopeptide (TPR) repeat protein